MCPVSLPPLYRAGGASHVRHERTARRRGEPEGPHGGPQRRPPRAALEVVVPDPALATQKGEAQEIFTLLRLYDCRLPR